MNPDILQMLRDMMARTGGAVPPKGDLGGISPPPQFSAQPAPMPQPPQPAQPMPQPVASMPMASAMSQQIDPETMPERVEPAADTEPSDLFGPDPLMSEQVMTPNEQANLRATSGMPAGPDYAGMAGSVGKALSTIRPPTQPEAPRLSAPGQYNAPQTQNLNPLLAMMLGKASEPDRSRRDQFALSQALGH